MRIARRKGVQRLRRKRVEQRIDGIRVGRLQAGVRLKPKPRGVLAVDIVVDTGRLYLLFVVAGVRAALTICQTIPVRRIAWPRTTGPVEWAAENPQGRPRRI